MKAINHLKTIIRHKHEVFKLCCKCGIVWQGIVHDLSKFSPIELFQGFKYWVPDRSPVNVAIDKNGYSIAWLHHQNKNKHHPGYWVDLDHNIKVPMPRKYIIEMFCDRVAASKVYKGKDYKKSDPYYYATAHYDEDARVMDEYTHKYLMQLLSFLGVYGEDVICKMIRKGEYNGPRTNYEEPAGN